VGRWSQSDWRSHSTGKSWVYPIYFNFDEKGDWSYAQPEEIDFEFTVKDHNDEEQPLRKKGPHDSTETLGVYLAPDGNNKTAIQELRKKSERWRDLVRTGHLSSKDAWIALNSTVIKTLEFPLPALTLKKKECEHHGTSIKYRLATFSIK